MALATAGTQLQSVFRNPLADPHIMGVSSGSALGAAIVTMVSGAAGSVFFGALGGAVVSAILVMLVAGRFRNASTVLIFGVLLGYILGAATSLLGYMSSHESLRIFYNWTVGSFATTSASGALVLLLVAVAVVIASLSGAKGLDIMMFGDEFASLSGASPRRISLVNITVCCVATAAVTSLCGPVGFVGIVAPHLARILLGTSLHRYVIPTAALCGASFYLIADILSQLSPFSLPVGSVVAVLGVPVIISILLSKRV
jgi:iron complex transport system permease protein